MEGLIDRVSGLCNETIARLTAGPARDRVLRAKERLDEPLRVAIAGNVNAGKSTLLNALLGERIAPTEQGECTQVVTWFRCGFPQRAEIVFRDARRPPVPLELTPEGMLPSALGVDPAAVDAIAVRRSNDLLDQMILIDTPGLGSTNAHISARTEQVLGERSLAAASRADALIYVMTQLPREDDQVAMAVFRSQFPDQVGSAANAVGVLNKADKGGGPRSERLSTAAAMARKHAADLSALVMDVVPMVGLLAETAERLDEEDASALRRIAAAGRREELLEDREDFLAIESGVPAAHRARLWNLLDALGLEHCLRWIDDGAASAKALRTRLRSTSGIDALRELLRTTLSERSGTLRVAAAVGQLESIAYSAEPGNADALAWLRGALDDLQLSPEWHQLSEMRAMQRAAGLEAALPADLYRELRRLLVGQTPAERLGLRSNASAATREREALRGAARWRSATAQWEDEDPELARIGRVAQRSYILLLEQSRVAA